VYLLQVKHGLARFRSRSLHGTQFVLECREFLSAIHGSGHMTASVELRIEEEIIFASRRNDTCDRHRDPALRTGEVTEGAMSNRNKAEIIGGLFAAYLANDRKAVEEALTVDFRFTSPYDDAIDKAAYFERCWRNADWIARHELERIFVEGDAAFVSYNCVAKSGMNFRNTEFFAFEGDQIKSIDVYFGASYENSVFVKKQQE
jgi:ketosteroid isomerase-like protein